MACYFHQQLALIQNYAITLLTGMLLNWTNPMTYYEIRYRHFSWNEDIWEVWDSLGTYSTVIDAIKAAIESYEKESNSKVELFFENDDRLPAKAGDIFWFKAIGSNFHNTYLKIVETSFPKTKSKVYPPTSYTHPKLHVTDWNVVDLMPLLK